MSHNPYAPPAADLGSEAPALASTGSGDFEIGKCLSEAWAKTWPNFWLWLGTFLVFGVVTMLATLTGIGILLAVPVLFWGYAYFTLRLYDGRAELADVFTGFSRYGQALVAMIVLFLVNVVVSLVGQSVEIVGNLLENAWVIGVGTLVNLGFAFLVTPRLYFSYMLAVERGLPPLEAARRSWEDTAGVRWKVAGLMLLTSAAMIVGMLALLVGMIPATLFVTLMWVSAYRQMFGGPAAA